MQKITNNTILVDGTIVRIASAQTIEVRLRDGQLATIYSTNSVHASQVKSNGFVADADGQYEFYIPNTRFDVNATGGGISGTESLTDLLAFDPASHGLGNLAGVTLTSVASADALIFNSATNQWVNVPLTTAFGYIGGLYVNLTTVSCGTPLIRGAAGSGFPTLDIVMTGTGWVQAWRTSSGMGGATANVGYISPDGIWMKRYFASAWGSVTAPSLVASNDLDTGIWWRAANVLSITASGGAGFIDLAGTYLAQNVPSYMPAGTLTAPSLTASASVRDGLYFPAANQVALTASGGFATAILSNCGFVVNNRIHGDAGGLTTSNYVISADATLALADQGKMIVGSHATVAIGIRIPATGTLIFPTGASIFLKRTAAASYTVVASSNVTVVAAALGVASKSMIQLYVQAPNVWYVDGATF